MTFGQFLEKSRSLIGLTQLEASKKFGFTSPQLLSNIERDLCGLPPRHFKKASDVYKIDIETLKKFHMESCKKKMLERMGRKHEKQKRRSK